MKAIPYQPKNSLKFYCFLQSLIIHVCWFLSRNVLHVFCVLGITGGAVVDERLLPSPQILSSWGLHSGRGTQTKSLLKDTLQNILLSSSNLTWYQNYPWNKLILMSSDQLLVIPIFLLSLSLHIENFWGSPACGFQNVVFNLYLKTGTKVVISSRLAPIFYTTSTRLQVVGSQSHLSWSNLLRSEDLSSFRVLSLSQGLP